MFCKSHLEAFRAYSWLCTEGLLLAEFGEHMSARDKSVWFNKMFFMSGKISECKTRCKP